MIRTALGFASAATLINILSCPGKCISAVEIGTNLCASPHLQTDLHI
jgi:hypothetical protein